MIRQAIITKVLPATETLPKRVKATAAGGGNITITFGDGMLSDIAVHKLAVRRLIEKLRWLKSLDVLLTPADYVAGTINRAGDIAWVSKDTAI